MQTKKEESDGSRRQQKDKHTKNKMMAMCEPKEEHKNENDGSNHELGKDGLHMEAKQDFLKATSSVLVITST
jgi:hypothetical protein